MILLGVLVPLLQVASVAAMDPLPWPKGMSRRGQANSPKEMLLAPLRLANKGVDPSQPVRSIEYIYGAEGTAANEYDARLKLDLNSEVIPLDSDKLGYDVLCDDVKRRSLEQSSIRLKIRFSEAADHHQILTKWVTKASKVKRSSEKQDVIFVAKVPARCVSNSTGTANSEQLTFLRVPAGEMSETLTDYMRLLKRNPETSRKETPVGFEVGIAQYTDLIDDVTVHIGQDFDAMKEKRNTKRQNNAPVEPRPTEPVSGDDSQQPGRIPRVYLRVKGFVGGAIEKLRKWWHGIFDEESTVPDPADIKHRTIDLNWTPADQYESEAFPGHLASTIMPRMLDDLMIECLDCYALGQQTYSVWLHFSLRNPTKPFDLKFWLDGQMELNIQAGIVAYSRVSYERRLAMLEYSLIPFFIPGIFNWGPMVSIEAETGVNWEAEGKGILGALMTWDNTTLRVDVNPLEAALGEPAIEMIEGNGWTPVTNTTVELMGSKTTFDIYSGVSFNIKFGLSLMSGVIGMWDIRLSDRYIARAGVGFSFTDLDWQKKHPNQTWETPGQDLINLLPDCEGWQLTAGFRYERFMQMGNFMRKTFFRKDSAPRGICLGMERGLSGDDKHATTIEPFGP
ncbi:hypothetical protein H072_8266 [Dactylellina haptotyla CBS 200.50]|uniref:Uncharacterized protein n=1 Tax=Dactylellina haptotyla (strain CBS 200.50) TaxID=1284197 RepID=S8BRZ8_DACHA|nr:hypothetical protein H072_8266 [Dactylellina haptotyla CBS 200.50]